MQKGIFERPSRITMFDFCYLHYKDQIFLRSQVPFKIGKKSNIVERCCERNATLLPYFYFSKVKASILLWMPASFLSVRPSSFELPFFIKRKAFGFLDTKKEGPKGLFSSPDAGLSGLFRKWNKVVDWKSGY